MTPLSPRHSPAICSDSRTVLQPARCNPAADQPWEFPSELKNGCSAAIFRCFFLLFLLLSFVYIVLPSSMTSSFPILLCLTIASLCFTATSLYYLIYSKP